jgi:hypothetical protein
MGNIRPITDKEREAAKKIRIRRRFAFILFLFFVPAVSVIDTLFDSDVISIPFGLTYFAVTGLLFISLAFSKCPRCKKFFFSTWFWSNPFTNKCLHCGLRLKGDRVK